MLESIRQNLKGTLFVVVIFIFIVPMVLTGVGADFGGGNAARDAATVDGESISNLTLERAIRNERARLLEMGGIDSASPLLEEGRLKSAVLDRLTRRAALVATGKDHNMAMSDASYANILMAQEAFFIDGQFDEERFRLLLSQSGYTASSYKKEISDDFLVQQQLAGLEDSAFVSDYEFAQIAKLTHQKRSFYSIKIPASSVSSELSISDDEMLAYYQNNQQEFTVPEKVRIEYIEIDVNSLAETIDVNEQDIRDQYDAEMEHFAGEDTYTVAHILIEDSDEEKINDVSKALSEGEEFSALAASYSDDIASSEVGGVLGVLTLGVYPEEFEQAVMELNEGEVSDPVVTDAGTHFIKAISKTAIDVPSFESREQEIKQALALAAAQEQYDLAVDQLGELTFSSDGLEEASQQLGLTINSSAFFAQTDAGTGSIVEFEKVRSAAFSDEVKVSGHNSNTLELSAGRTIVLRVAETQDAFVKELADVSSIVEEAVRSSKLQEKLSAKVAELKQAIENGESAQALASDAGLEFSEQSLVSRSMPNVDFMMMSLAFGAAKPISGGVSFADGNSIEGDKLLIGVTDVVDGDLSDLAEGEREAIESQLLSQAATLEMSSYFETIYSTAEVETN